MTCGLLTDWDGEALTELARITAYELRTLAVLTVGHSIERDTRILIAGIGNRRTALNRETVGCPVLSVGIPTVVDSGTLLRDALAQAGLDAENVPQALQDVLTAGQSFIVTPRDCDAVTECTAILLARAVDAAFGIDRESVKTDGDD